VLANAQHIRNVPGRKPDVNNATWIADLLAHGLIRGSFVPPVPIQQLPDLTRTRRQLVRELAQHARRLQKVLEDANLKIASVLTDIVAQVIVAEVGTDMSRLPPAGLVTTAWARASWPYTRTAHHLGSPGAPSASPDAVDADVEALRLQGWTHA